MPTDDQIRQAILNFLQQRKAFGDHEYPVTQDVNLGELAIAKGWDHKIVGNVAFLMEQEGFIATTREVGVIPPNAWLTQEGRSLLDPNSPYNQRLSPPRHESINVGGNFYGAAATGGGRAQASVTLQAHHFLENLREAVEEIPDAPEEERSKLRRMVDSLLKHPLALPIAQWALDRTLGG